MTRRIGIKSEQNKRDRTRSPSARTGGVCLLLPVCAPVFHSVSSSQQKTIKTKQTNNSTHGILCQHRRVLQASTREMKQED